MVATIEGCNFIPQWWPLSFPNGGHYRGVLLMVTTIEGVSTASLYLELL